MPTQFPSQPPYDQPNYQRDPMAAADSSQDNAGAGYGYGAGYGATTSGNSDLYGGSGIGNRGGMQAENHACRGHEHSLVLTAPPLGVVVFAAE